MLNRLRQIRAAVVGDLEKYLIRKMTGNSSLEFPRLNGQVDERTALSITTHLACVKAIGEDLGGLTRKVYRRGEGDGDRIEERDSALGRLLRQPNDWMTSQEFFGAMTSRAVAWGNAYALMEFDSRYNVRQMWPLNPARVYPKLVAGQMTYLYYNEEKNVQEYLDPESVWHLKGATLDGVTGMSLIQQAAQAFELANVQEMYAANFFANSARPDLYLKHPGELSPNAKASITDTIEKAHQGVSRAHKIMVLEEGMEPQAISMPLKDMMLIESRRMSDIQILGLHRMPPHKIGILDRSTFSNIEHQAIQYVTDVIQPWATRIEQSLMRCLLGPGEMRNLYIEHVYDSLLRADVKSRNEAFAALRNIGVMNANGILAKLNEPKIEGPAGETYWMPSNMMDAANPPTSLNVTQGVAA